MQIIQTLFFNHKPRKQVWMISVVQQQLFNIWLTIIAGIIRMIQLQDSGDCQSQTNSDLFHTSSPMGAPMTVIGLVNGMIGGTCLVLPQIGLKTGYLTTIIVCAVTGFISYYTAYLIVLHLGKGKQIKDCILSHFNNDYSYMTGYSLFIWISFMPLMLIYFRIICLQIQGLLGYHSDMIGIFVAIGLIVIITLVRIFHVGEETLAYGIISIVGYLAFLVWAQVTAPSGPKTVPANVEPVSLASTLIMAYSIHDFLVANIIKNPNREQYHGIVRWTFVIGTVTYAFIALGSFAIVNRAPFKAIPETINDFFRAGEWQNSLIEVVYMIHMVSAYPNFLIISKIRFFQMFKIEIAHRISLSEILYISLIVIGSYLVYVSGIHLEVMISINGAVVGFSYVVVIPIWLHLKCVFFDRSSGYIQNDQEWNAGIVPNGCECDNVYKNRFMLYLETIFLILVIIVGMGLMAFTLINVVNGKIQS